MQCNSNFLYYQLRVRYLLEVPSQDFDQPINYSKAGVRDFHTGFSRLIFKLFIPVIWLFALSLQDHMILGWPMGITGE